MVASGMMNTSANATLGVIVYFPLYTISECVHGARKTYLSFIVQ